jgi:hypothetical protein
MKFTWQGTFTRLLCSFVIISQLSSASSSSGPKPPSGLFSTWSFLSPSRRMEWNELPSHVQLRSKIIETTDGDDSIVQRLMLDADVLIVGAATGDCNTTTANWMQVIGDAARSDEDDASWEKALNLLLLQQEIKDSPAGTLSSATLVLPTRNASSPPLSIYRKQSVTTTAATPQHICCLHLGKATATVTSDSSNSTTGIKSNPVLKLARGLGTAIGTVVSKRSAQSSAGKATTTIRVFLPSLPVEAWSEMAVFFWTELYNDERYKGTGDDKTASTKTPVEVEFVVLENNTTTDDIDGSSTALREALHRGASLARGVYLSKDIVNAPHNVLNSLSLAETAQRLTQSYRSVLTCQILSAAECERRGMGAFLGVARASETEPQFIHITYKAPRRHVWDKKRHSTRKLGVIGKGLLFDTGGYNIKTQLMEYMKFDCGGAAAILGAARSIAELEPADVEVHFVVAACENMINERGMVPGDILTASNGKTIEVINTDA